MKRPWRSLILLVAVWFAAPVSAQDDPSKEYFAAYQEFQRAERLEREGRTEEAVAKFRLAASQISQIKTQNPDWQPLMLDFRLRKTQEAIVRLEGALDSPTLGPAPDLTGGAEADDDTLPPVSPPNRGASVSVSISPGMDADSAGPTTAAPDDLPSFDGGGGGNASKLEVQLRAERDRAAQLEAKLKQTEAELVASGMELEKTKVVVNDLNFRLKQSQDGAAVPADQSGELAELNERIATLEGTVQTAAAEKEQLSAELASARGSIGELTARATAAEESAATAKSESDTARARVAELEGEREKILGELESTRSEVKLLAGRVTELENDKTMLIAARDEAQREATEAKTALEKSADLIEANRQLEEKLSEAATKLAGMEDDAKAKETVIAGLQSDLDNVRAELAGAQTKLKDDRQRFDQLQAVNDQLLRQYDEVTGALAAVKLGDVSAAEAKLIQQENELLRGIIMRQIKEQARREQAYRLAQEEMERLEIRSDTLNDKINELAKPTLELTDAEEEMLRSPVVTLLDADAAKMSAKVEVLKPKVDGLEPEPSPSPEETPAEAAATAPAAEATPAATAEASPATAEETPATEAAAAAPLAPPALPPEVQELIDQAREAFIGGNFARAEDLYQKFVDLQPDNVVALANLGVAQFRQGKLTAAQLALERAVKIAPEDSFSLTTLGAVMIEQGRSEDAVVYLDRANTVTADDPITLNYLGVASSQLGQFGKAEQSLRRAITVKPDYAEAHFNLAVIYATAKPPSIALAKRHYEKALELGAGPDKRLANMLQASPGG